MDLPEPSITPSDVADQSQEITAMGFWTDAKQMLMAAEILARSGEHKVMMPTYYLLGHAIEEALKSFLLANGDDLDRLKLKIGHDIAKAARRAIAKNCDPVSGIVKDFLPTIEMLSPYYKGKEFEYRVTGYKSLPNFDALILPLGNLLNKLQPIARKVHPQR